MCLSPTSRWTDLPSGHAIAHRTGANEYLLLDERGWLVVNHTGVPITDGVARPVCTLTKHGNVSAMCDRLDPGRQPLRLEPDICNLPRNPAEALNDAVYPTCRRNCPKRRVRRYITGLWPVARAIAFWACLEACPPPVNRKLGISKRNLSFHNARNAPGPRSPLPKAMTRVLS